MFVRSRVVACALALVPALALATVVVQQSFEQMTHTASMIVRGKVQSSTAQLVRDGKAIETFTTLEVTDVLKGPAAKTVVIRQPGGVVGRQGQAVAGVATFTPGEDVIVFLSHPGDDAKANIVMGLSYGKITVEKTSLGEIRAFRDARGLGSYDPQTAVVHPVNSREDLGLADAFVSRLRRAVEGTR